MVAVTVFACGPHGWGAGFPGNPAVNTVQVGLHQQLSVFHALDPSGMRLMAGSAYPDFIEWIHLVLREYFVGSVAIPAIGCRRFRSLEHCGVPAPGYLFSFFLMTAFTLRPGQAIGVGKCLHAYMALDACQLAVDAPENFVSVEEEAGRIFPFLQAGLRRHDHCFPFLRGNRGDMFLAVAVQAAPVRLLFRSLSGAPFRQE